MTYPGRGKITSKNVRQKAHQNYRGTLTTYPVEKWRQNQQAKSPQQWHTCNPLRLRPFRNHAQVLFFLCNLSLDFMSQSTRFQWRVNSKRQPPARIWNNKILTLPTLIWAVVWLVSHSCSCVDTLESARHFCLAQPHLHAWVQLPRVFSTQQKRWKIGLGIGKTQDTYVVQPPEGRHQHQHTNTASQGTNYFPPTPEGRLQG